MDTIQSQVEQVQNCTSHKEFPVIIRPAFKHATYHQYLSDQDELMDPKEDTCRAALFNHIIYWVAKKQGKGHKYWWASTANIREDMIETWSHTKMNAEICVLVEDGLLGRCQKDPYNKTSHYYFGENHAKNLRARCQKQSICLLHEDLPKEVFTLFFKTKAILPEDGCGCNVCTHRLSDLINGFGKSDKRIYRKHQTDLVNTQNQIGNTELVPRTHTQNSTQREKSPADNLQTDTTNSLSHNQQNISSSSRSSQYQNREGKRESVCPLPPPEPAAIQAMYEAFDKAYQANFPIAKSYQSPRTSVNDAAMIQFIHMGATQKQLQAVIKSLHNDSDPFYGKNLHPSYIASQYSARLGMIAKEEAIAQSNPTHQGYQDSLSRLEAQGAAQTYVNASIDALNASLAKGGLS